MRLILLAILLVISTPTYSQTPGPYLLSGPGAPVSSIGAESNFYLNTSTGDIFGPKSFGVWGAASAVIVSPSNLAAQIQAIPTWVLFARSPRVAPAVPTLSSCGTSPTVTARSTASFGTFTTGTGAPTACTVTFSVAYTTASFCTVTPSNAAAAAIVGGYFISATTNGSFTLTLGTGTSNAQFNYTCGGN